MRTLLANSAFVLFAATYAHAISGGAGIDVDDPGARATVLVRSPLGMCSGMVYGDHFIITAAHCLVSRDFKSTADPRDVTVEYQRITEQEDKPAAQAAAIVIHENFLKQWAAWANAKDDVSFSNALINHEDIGLIRITGMHPPHAVSAVLPEINNEYVVCCLPRPRTWPLLWMDIYGYGSPKHQLGKARLSTGAPDMVQRGREPNRDQPYTPRKFMVSSENPADTGTESRAVIGICHGDSGGPAFFVAVTRNHVVPNASIKLIDGRPLAVGLISNPGSPKDCDDSLSLVRLDYYRDWIEMHRKQLQ